MGGCVHVDEMEENARERAKQLFNASMLMCTMHSGSQANMGVYLSVLQPGDTVLGMNLTAGRSSDTRTSFKLFRNVVQVCGLRCNKGQ